MSDAITGCDGEYGSLSAAYDELAYVYCWFEVIVLWFVASGQVSVINNYSSN